MYTVRLNGIGYSLLVAVIVVVIWWGRCKDEKVTASPNYFEEDIDFFLKYKTLCEFLDSTSLENISVLKNYMT